MYTLENLNEHPVFRNFISLTKIPHPSYHEKEISDFLVEFAKKNGLEVRQDETLNVIIKKKASAGYENKETVILQGHIDMVPEKADSSNHDFQKDPLALRIKDNYLYATDTTLGADNGIAVAFAMSILEDKNAVHPPLEVIFTTSEEVGMNGAVGLDASDLKGTRLLNIDSEEEGIFFVSCAGGNVIKVTFTPNYIEEKNNLFEIEVKGFRGGHSGMEIIKQRGNAIKLMGRLLTEISPKHIAEISGGAKHNAISRACKAIVTIDDENNTKQIIEKYTKIFKDEYRDEDNIEILFNKVDARKVMDDTSTMNLIRYMTIVPDGVQTMMLDMEKMVESSLNVGVLEMKDGDVIFTHAIRSSMKSRKVEISNIVKSLAEIASAKWEVFSDYPEWQYEKDSKLKEIVLDTYRKVTNKEPEIMAIHAGLECGILKEKLPNTEMISFGPDMFDVHTPNEHLSIDSTLRSWEFIKELLKAL